MFTYPEWFAYRDRDAEAFRAVAQLFAIYHHGPPPAHPFLGRQGVSLGTALRPLADDSQTGRESGTGARLLNGLIRRQRLPSRELHQVCVTLRKHRLPPPHWQQLALDLGDWGTRLHRNHGPGGPLGPRTVAEGWSEDFHRSNGHPG
ncbi:type I-E CRISPR-associated protein Cse2/CasB [Streptomyces griseoviridis]|uniref:type I-E CRISPR-associated protein Cse2/CasB n=1 Tax=Streptomyces griseoviridis TaxID=45398 RepID=UPI0034060AAB